MFIMTTISLRKLSFYILLILLICPSIVLSQSNNSINGFVFGIERQPIPQISVELLDEYHRTIARVQTDGTGKYSFLRLAQGRYYIQVISSNTNYEEQVKELEIINISRQPSASDNFQVDFNLKIKRNTNTTAAAVVFVQEVPENAKKAYQRGIDALERRNQAEGIAEIKKATELFSQYYLAYERLGQEYIKLRNYTEAYNSANKAIEINSKGFENWYTAGYAAYYLKNYQEAIKILNKALTLKPDSVNTLFVQGLSLRQIGRYEDAEKSLLKAQKFAGILIPEICWQLALLYTNNLKKYNSAAENLEAFLKAKPNYEEADKVRELIKKLRLKSNK
jgi:tetratricopeptide (TPR) repeat protein